jgi:N-acetylglucosaminyldiphosphoundecaprenol N-acetyl-beta-D-mannosaminyltransferase
MKYEIFGIKINKVSMDGIVHLINGYLSENTKRIVFYINAHSINISNSDKAFVKNINLADLVYCGGLGPVIAARILKNIKLSKTTTPDFIFEILSLMEKNNRSVFFLGGKDNDLFVMVNKLKKMFPKLKIAGFNNGYFSDNKLIISKINKARPDLLLIGMGSPMQEKWIIDNYAQINAKVFWSVGAIFEILSGKYKRLPKILNDYGFEWVFRLIQEPRRLWRRYLIGNVIYSYNLVREYLRNK